jgi:hypothetical protein
MLQEAVQVSEDAPESLLSNPTYTAKELRKSIVWFE